MKNILTLFLIFQAFVTFSQNDPEKIDLNVLQAPVSPAANLLGISNSEILKPTDPTGFMALINQSRNEGAFAIDIAPYWLFGGSKITLEDYISNKRNFQNSFVISLATQVNEVDINSPLQNKRQVALGFKFSPERGELSKETRDAIEKHLEGLKKTSDEWSTLLQTKLASDIEYQQVKIEFDEMWRSDLDFSMKQSLKTLYTGRLSEIESKVAKEIEASYEADIEKLEFKRVGNKLDISGGLVYDALESAFTDGNVVKGGIWATYEWAGVSNDDGVSMLFLVRYLVNPDLSFTDESGTFNQDDINNLDLGARIYYQKENNPLSISFEWIYRDYNDKVVEDGSRYTFNIAYDIGSNNQLSLALGKNYDGTITRDDNIIAALNLLIGLAASKKPF